MTAPNSLWAVTNIEHPALRDVRGDCDECLKLVSPAITQAKVLGAVGCTFQGNGHGVTVNRAALIAVRPGEIGSDDITFTADQIVESEVLPAK